MAIKTFGRLTFTEVVAEFADTKPHRLSEFYRNGGKVPTNNINIPTTGTIKFSNFYNAVNRITAYISYSTNQQEIAVNPTTAPGYVAGITDIVITINSGIYIWSDSVSAPALIINGGLSSGDTVTLVNNGFIMGKGGRGGFNNIVPGNQAQSGGPAMSILTPIRITNNSYIGGGGGGGSEGGGGGAGGGDGGVDFSNYANRGIGGSIGNIGTAGNNFIGDNGGGGGRIMPGVGGAGGTTRDSAGNRNYGGKGGGAGGGGGGQASGHVGGVGGSGGSPGSAPIGPFYAGGGGGGWGAAGGQGIDFNGASPPGAGGRAIQLNGNSVTWITAGIVYGAVS